MPIYEYQCVSCNSVHTEVRKISSRDDKSVCDKCGCDCNKILSPTKFNYSTDVKTPQIFKDKMKELHSKTPGSTMDSYGVF